MFNMHITRRGWFLAAGFGVTASAQNIHEEIRSAADHAPMRMQFPGGSAADCRHWQQTFRSKLHAMLGPHQPPARWVTITEKTVELDDHTRHSLLLRADGARDLPVHLLVPKVGQAIRLPAVRRPAIVALHGHGDYGYDSVAGVATTADEKSAIAGANYDYGLQLVRRGYVVAAPCFTPFGRRLGNRAAYKNQDACGVTFVRMQLLGKLLIAENLRDALWSIELLAKHPDVDAARIGCVGLSLGGRMTMLTAAISPKIRVAVISGALNMLQERILGVYGCGAQVIPGLLEYGDVPEIASLIAPRPCLWEVGNNDALMVKDRIPPALDRMKRAWSALDAGTHLDVDRFEGKHQWNGVKAYPLLASVLNPPESK